MRSPRPLLQMAAVYAPHINRFFDAQPLTGRELFGREHSCRSEEMETEFLQGSEIDLHELLQQQYFLALPIKALCNDECKGLCSECGGDRNRNDCHCQQKTSSAFGVLHTLVK